MRLILYHLDGRRGWEEGHLGKLKAFFNKARGEGGIYGIYGKRKFLERLMGP